MAMADGRRTYLERNTDLSKFSHGNFDFNFDPTSHVATVVVRVKPTFEEGISAEEKSAFISKLHRAVDEYWHDKAVLVPADGEGPAIRVHVVLQENERSYHKVVDVERERTWPFTRPWVGRDLNVGLGTDVLTLAHEVGHVLANYDEYDGGWIENRGWWHDNNHFHEQNEVLMGNGTQLRPRYFDHFARKVSSWAGKRYVPQIQTAPSAQPVYAPRTEWVTKATPARRVQPLSETRVLKAGLQGNDVRSLQKLLNRNLRMGLEVDGKFGPKTERAVKSLQGLYGLNADGVVGPKTRPLLSETPYGLQRGMSGDSITQLQRRLNERFGTGLATDGKFGPLTERAVKSAQRMYGLKQDGIWGRKTSLAASEPPTRLRQGMEGGHVSALQERLNSQFGSALRIDGKFGPRTAQSLRSVQRFYGLPGDGVFGPKSRVAIDSGPPPTIQMGSRGTSVKGLQRFLASQGYKLKPDGAYGPITQAAVRDYQGKRGLRQEWSHWPSDMGQYLLALGSMTKWDIPPRRSTF